ncbi:hypothetical protein KW783_03090 [Candidatus Parcubacteria bacterium]|nr:hypothetical protein [Candidatus Parcubacteria bacterium]
MLLEWLALIGFALLFLRGCNDLDRLCPVRGTATLESIAEQMSRKNSAEFVWSIFLFIVTIFGCVATGTLFMIRINL